MLVLETGPHLESTQLFIFMTSNLSQYFVHSTDTILTPAYCVWGFYFSKGIKKNKHRILYGATTHKEWSTIFSGRKFQISFPSYKHLIVKYCCPISGLKWDIWLKFSGLAASILNIGYVELVRKSPGLLEMFSWIRIG